MDVTKPYKFIGFGAMDVTKPYKFIGFGAMAITKPCKFIGFGARSTSSSFRIGPVAVQLVVQSIGVLVGTRLNAVELMRRGCRLPDITASRLAWVNIVLSLFDPDAAEHDVRCLVVSLRSP